MHILSSMKARLTNFITFSFTLYLKQTKGGTRPQQASDETKHTIKVHFSALVDIAFGSKGINFNAYGVKWMMLTYTKAFDALEHQKIKDKYFL